MSKKYTENELIILFDDYFERGIIPRLNENEYKVQFDSYRKLAPRKLPYFYDIDHFCTHLQISPRQVRFFLSNKEKAYKTFEVSKKCGGLREINAPKKEMKFVQRWILDNILYKLKVSDYAHGFIPEKTMYTNAKVHVNKDFVLGVDIKDFFPSIKYKSVERVFKSAGYNSRIAKDFANLCTYHNKLPQGAPTSPMLANLVSLNLDKNIAKYCLTKNLDYSRYADDITVSGSHKISMHKENIIRIIEQDGFKVNYEKVRILSKGSRQKVTGLIVNDKISIGTRRKKTLRAIVHNILVKGPVSQNKNNDPFFRERIFGHLAFAKSIEPEFAIPLVESLKQIDWSEYFDSVKEQKEIEMNINFLKRMPKTIPVNTNFMRTKNIFVSKSIKETVRIATVQLDFTLSSSFPPGILDKSGVFNKINRVLEKANKNKVDIICFPELSFCQEWLPQIKEKYSDITIIAGSYYSETKNNVCQIISNSSNYIPPQLKIKPSIFEKGEYIQKMVPGELVNIYTSQYGKFAVLICRDFPVFAPYLRDRTDIIFVPSYNKEVNRFYSDAQTHVQNCSSYVIISNSSQYGGTSIFGIMHNAYFDELMTMGYKRKNDKTYNLCEIKEKEEGLIFADFNIVHKSIQIPTVSDPEYEIKPVTNIKRIPL
ncbi:retron St85 family RNA-directed DNA polymerase [Methanosarcina sp.]|uniref:retron St85 family RNA-directed DNA polymerase n=1 Tax=Methanosarcina sp. TaxID=2213 RepID=UPI002988721A|nr:retron St85 family RNA-directed DNA polymerase [Methanosarcina sp.]MDW5548754.1 retron St85 family RNA-directed DNA polymerase [Methanosarcina sp.]MDW5553667.1 retron St85 family RNA-directed DNA polymerase [Methanosarcina sp.]MDW5558893.1 retron St85 family RNA-directed DNA polymerase [Methanosarcina sp.]